MRRTWRCKALVLNDMISCTFSQSSKIPSCRARRLLFPSVIRIMLVIAPTSPELSSVFFERSRPRSRRDRAGAVARPLIWLRCSFTALIERFVMLSAILGN